MAVCNCGKNPHEDWCASWTAPSKKPKRKPGRRTREEELREYVEATDGDMEKLAAFLGGELKPKEVASAKDIRERLMASLSDKVGSLQGVALVQALKAITAIATVQEAEQSIRDEQDDRRPILDRLDALPPDYATRLLKDEISRVDGYQQDLRDALRKLEGK
jgi:hypothetical protein